MILSMIKLFNYQNVQHAGDIYVDKVDIISFGWAFVIGLVITFFLIIVYPLVLADNSTRKDWEGDEKGKYCELIQHDITIYPNGTSAETHKKIKSLCAKSA